MDWSLLSSQYYDVPRRMVVKIGNRIGKILNTWMKKMCIEPNNVHILGHSLGAHVAGNVGKYFNGTIGR